MWHFLFEEVKGFGASGYALARLEPDMENVTMRWWPWQNKDVSVWLFSSWQAPVRPEKDQIHYCPF